ncbi:MAG TPA: S41 family peptidase [Rhizomicrobium sp.]|nr:S41 family peptidase [Rhizomicrobium sp.]
MDALKIVGLGLFAACLLRVIPTAAGADTSKSDSAATFYAPAIETLAGDLAHDYVFPDIGHQYAALLQANLEKGAYRGITDPVTIGQHLTDDLRALHMDLHLRVRPVPGTKAAPSPAQARPPIEGAAWLAPGIAYIRFNLFPGTPKSVAATDKFMRDHASAKAIIIDARHNHGGGGDEMNVMLPYLFGKRTVPVDMELARDTAKAMGFAEDRFFHRVPAPEGHIRFEQVIEPSPTEHRLFAAKVYYLTSLDTGSAAEALAFIFKITHRATLVGERTRGMGHFGSFVEIGQGLECFMPVGRTFDPATGADWEGTGVTPDVVVPPDQALDAAVKMAQRA